MSPEIAYNAIIGFRKKSSKINVLQTNSFEKIIKKLHKNQKQDLDKAIIVIVEAPSVGELKKGDLSSIRVYKFKMVNQPTLLAYQFNEDHLTLILLTLGSHENL